MSRKLNQRGDTIIEVLIAIAVASSVLGIVYATMNKNLRVMRDNQERSEALRIAQGQIETIQSILRADTYPLDSMGSFCIGPGAVPVNLTGGIPAADLNAEIYSSYDPACVQSFYHIAATYEGAPAYRYSVFVRWERLGGGNNEVILVFRDR